MPPYYQGAPATHFNYRDNTKIIPTIQQPLPPTTSNIHIQRSESCVGLVSNGVKSLEADIVTKNTEVSTTEFNSSNTLNIDYSSDPTSSSQEDLSDCDSYTIESVGNTAGELSEIIPGRFYQVLHGVSRIRVLGKDIKCTNQRSNKKLIYQVTHQGSEFYVHADEVKLIRRSNRKESAIKSQIPEEGGADPIPKDASTPKSAGNMSRNIVNHSVREGDPKSVHVLLPREEDPGAKFWAEVPESSISKLDVGELFDVEYEGKVFQVTKANIAQIEIENDGESTVIPVTETVELRSFAKVYVGGEWQVFSTDKVKESIRKPGTYVVKMTEKNVRVRRDLVEFFEKEAVDGTVDCSLQQNLGTVSDATASATSTKLDVLQYSVFIEGKFVLLNGKHVRPIHTKPGYYKVLHLSRKYVVHMNLVLPVVWDSQRGEEVVIAPTHFRVLSEEGEYILPAEMVRPDPGVLNVFIVRSGLNQSVRVKSGLMFPMWLNSDTICVTDSTEMDELTLNETEQQMKPDLNKTLPLKKAVLPHKSTLPKPLARSASFRTPDDYNYKVFKDGKYFLLDNSKVEEITSLTGFYKICIAGEWSYHPAYCFTRVLRRPTLRRTLSLERLTNTSWEESLRRHSRAVEIKGGKPRWRHSFTGESVTTRGGKLNEIRESRLLRAEANTDPKSVLSEQKSVVSEQLSCGTVAYDSKQNVHSSFARNTDNITARSKTSSGLTISGLSSVSLTSR